MNKHSNSLSRRKALALGAGAATVCNLASASDPKSAPPLKDSLKSGDVILFQGDSITDAGRDKKKLLPNDSRALGRGYPSVIASGLLVDHAKLNLKVYNRGISGNKVPDLDRRWQKDCIALKPKVLSILIGVNDIWHKLNGRYDGTAEVYRDGFAALLDKTKKELPDTKIVICEPFVLRCGAVTDKWFPEFDTRRKYAHEVATAAGATWVPFQTMFDDAVAKDIKPAYWGQDGVHPSHAGHGLMANIWRKTVGL